MRKTTRNRKNRHFGQGFYWVDGIGLFLIDPDGRLHKLTTELWAEEDSTFEDDNPNDIKAFKQTAVPMKLSTEWMED